MAADQPAALPLGAARVAGNVDLGHEDQRFIGQLREMLAAAPPSVIANTQVISGYRTEAQQKEIYDRHVAKYGSGDVYGHQAAHPGHSKHNVGLAADLSFSSPEAQAWFYQNAKDYGLHFPVPGDIGHIEPTWARGAGAPAMMASAQPAGRPAATAAPAQATPAAEMPPTLRAALTAPAPPQVAAADEPKPAAAPAMPAAPTLTTPLPGQPYSAYRAAVEKIGGKNSANPFA